jgi:hypothetical protein
VDVGRDAIAPDEDPRGGEADHGAPSRGRAHRRGAAAGAAGFVVVALAGGIGWLYVLRSAGLLSWGPAVPGALVLQQLAGSDAQPLSRLAGAWIPAGVVAGLVLRRAGVGTPARVAVVGVLAILLLMAAGAVADAASVSGPLASHISGQLSRSGTWVAAALMTLGALLVRSGAPAAQAAPSGR